MIATVAMPSDREAAATESVAAVLAGGITLGALREAIAAQTEAVTKVGSGSDREPRPDLALLSYLQALEALLRDRPATAHPITKSSPPGL